VRVRWEAVALGCVCVEQLGAGKEFLAVMASFWRGGLLQGESCHPSPWCAFATRGVSRHSPQRVPRAPSVPCPACVSLPNSRLHARTTTSIAQTPTLRPAGAEGLPAQGRAHDHNPLLQPHPPIQQKKPSPHPHPLPQPRPQPQP